MKDKSIIADILIIIIICCIGYYSLFQEHSFEEHVMQAELIIQGRMIKKYVKKEVVTKEYFLDYASAMTADFSVLTTYVFVVDDVLKGDYDNKYIEVKMLGGCLSHNHCSNDALIYDFASHEKSLLLLKFVEQNDTYQMSHPACSAFTIDEKGDLIRKPVGEIGDKRYQKAAINQHKEDVFTQMFNDHQYSLMSLKNMIN